MSNVQATLSPKSRTSSANVLRGYLAAVSRSSSASFATLLSGYRMLCLTLLMATFAAWFLSFKVVGDATHSIGYDTAPSVVAAEKARTSLASANGSFANVMLSGDLTRDKFVSAMRQDVRNAETLLVDAAQNITFGDEEKDPLVTLSRGVAEYAQAIGFIRGSSVGKGAVASDLESVDTLMHFQVLPAASELDRVNLDYMNRSYATFRASSFLGYVAATLSVLAILALVRLQYLTFRKTNRLVNVGLLLSTFVVVGLTLVGGYRYVDACNALYVAKEQAFDSIAPLSKAKAIAEDVDAAARYALLAHGDPTLRTTYEARFHVRGDSIVHDPDRAKALLAQGSRFEGLLGDELANITFDGEQAVATRTFENWSAYLLVADRVRALGAADRIPDAFALAIGDAPDQLNGAFTRFLAAIDETIGINVREFRGAISRSESEVNLRLYLSVLVAWISASISCWFGVHVRIKDYS